MAANDFDDILTLLGTSKWNIIRYLLFGLLGFMMPSIVLSSIYVAPPVDASCLVKDTLVKEVKECSYFTYVNSSKELGVVEKSCSQWTFESEHFPKTMTQEFNLVCEDAYLRPTFQTVYMLGNFFGGPLTGYISDRFGRKVTFFVGVTGMLLTMGISSFLNNIGLILFLRILSGFCHPAIISTGYILCLELTEPKFRSTVGILISLPWAIGTMWFGYLGYVVRDWRWFQRASLVPGVIFLCLAFFFIIESPRWQIVKGKHDEAMNTLKIIAKLNHVKLPDEELLRERMKEIQESSITQIELKTKKKNRSFIFQKTCPLTKRILILIRTPEMRRRTILLSLTFFVSSFVFYGLSVNAVNFGLDPFMYTIIGGITEIPAYTIVAPIIAKFGRVKPTIISYFVCGITLIAIGFIPSGMELVIIILAMCGKLFISSAYQIIYLINTEIAPTEVRLQALGTSNFVSRIGSMISPYISDSRFSRNYPWVPSTIFGVASLMAAVGAIFLPESLNVHLPETIAQLEEETIKKKAGKAIRSMASSADEMTQIKV